MEDISDMDERELNRLSESMPPDLNAPVAPEPPLPVADEDAVVQQETDLVQETEQLSDHGHGEDPANRGNVLEGPQSTEMVREEEPDEELVQPINGDVLSPDEDDYEDINNEDLSPPPDTPVDESLSQVSSVPINALEDEIVVGTKAQLLKSSPHVVSPDHEDLEMEDADKVEEQQTVSHYPKRKRASVYNDLSEDKIENSMGGEEAELVHRTLAKPKAVQGALTGVKGVMLGYWRESGIKEEEDKHGVIGFIDIRERLRTRIQPTSRFGKLVNDKYPIPPGPGGSWVTFDKICFDPHLVNLDHYQVKEYVKIRAMTMRRDETPEETKELNREAVKEALRRLQENPPPDNPITPAIAYGPEIPEHAQIPARPEVKKRRVGSAAGNFVAGSPAAPATIPASVDPLPGTRPTKILLGYWAGSSEPNEADRHAVFGILGANDMFRVKVTRETRDGRRVEGNFPSGAGALWIHWHDVVFETHLQALSRPEVKEYVRVRQRQVDEGEDPEDRLNNETVAVMQAQMRWAAISRREPIDESIKLQGTPVAPKDRLSNGAGIDDGLDAKREFVGHELRNSRRSDLQAPRVRHSLPDSAIRTVGARSQNEDALERTNDIARREIARVEAAQARADQRAARHSSVSSSFNKKAAFQENISRLNKVWSHQEAARQQAGVEDAKIHNGVKYERKQLGPFQGKLVSQGTIISIDGEDYVEYRVLTKPTFV